VNDPARVVRCLSFAVALALATAAASDARASERALAVSVSAYNSVRAQTSATPWTGAWGDSLEPGMRSIAVSRDLLALGIRRGTVVEIEGLGRELDGKYVVLDKMARRWRHKVDVYMGADVPAARRFGRRRATIRWFVAPAAAPAPAVGMSIARSGLVERVAESEAGQ